MLTHPWNISPSFISSINSTLENVGFNKTKNIMKLDE